MTMLRMFTGAALLLALGADAQAADTMFGGQLTLSKPQGDLGDSQRLDGKIGYGLGVHALVDLKNGHAILPRFDYTSYKRSGNGLDLVPKVWNYGVDYNYYINGKTNEGLYLAAGVGYSIARAELREGSFFAGFSKESFSLDAGVGYMFTPNFGGELKYNHASYDFAIAGKMTVPAINLSFIARM